MSLDRSLVPYLLLNIPLTDPTVPYHSIPYLVGTAAAHGFTNATCVDANIEALNWNANPERVAELCETARQVRTGLEQAGAHTRRDQLRYRTALQAVGMRDDSIMNAIEVLRSTTDFYDYGLYRHSVFVLEKWLELQSLYGIPGMFDGFELNINGPMSFTNIDDLTNVDLLAGYAQPFSRYFEGPFGIRLRQKPWALIGLSVNYASQLPYALWMLRIIREACPAALVCVGGTEIADDFKYLRDKRKLWLLFQHCDALVLGEGESALVGLLEVASQTGPAPKPDLPGVLWHTSETAKVGTTFKYEDVANLAPPRYDVWDWSAYWSPAPVVLYSPTRGCYWNKCTFCDYGLNTDRPTSPSRERSPMAAIEDLGAISSFSQCVYFAVDAMSPVYLKKLSQALQQAPFHINWAAELRLERAFVKQRLGSGLKSSGCVAISFGYESGSQRILDAIDKGVPLTVVPSVLEELAAAGVGSQMMGFVGFPGESPQEAVQTFSFLERNKHLWTLAGIGDFVLTPGAIVAKRPEMFGIAECIICDGDDIVRSLLWSAAGGELHGGAGERSVDVDSASVVTNTGNFDRPWVGGIDSAHSLLYFSRFGRILTPGSFTQPPIEAQIQIYSTSLDLLDEFARPEDMSNYHAEQRRDRRRAPTAAELSHWLDEPTGKNVGVVSSEGSAAVQILPSGEFLVMDPHSPERPTTAYEELIKLLLLSSGQVV